MNHTKLFSFPLLFLFLLAFAVAEPISIADGYFVSVPVTDELLEAEYLITPTPYATFTLTLSGSTGYVPSMSINDAEEERIVQLNAEEGGTITYTFTPGEDVRDAKSYTVFINTYGQGVATSYSFGYEEVMQNDADLGMDATKRFKEAETIAPGEYTGFLADEDDVDYYSMQLTGGEDITITLRPVEKGSLGLTLIDGEYNTRIDQKVHIEEDLIAHFSSNRAQQVWLGIEGSIAYNLIIESTEDEPEVVVVPVVEEENKPEVVVPEPELIDDEPEVVPVVEEEVTDGKSKMTGLVIFTVAVVLLVILVLFTVTRNRELKEELKEAKTKSKKKAAKK